MTISDELKSHLLYLTYAAQFDFPMKKGIERVFGDLIEPKLPFHPTKEYLIKINRKQGSKEAGVKSCLLLRVSRVLAAQERMAKGKT